MIRSYLLKRLFHPRARDFLARLCRFLLTDARVNEAFEHSGSAKEAASLLSLWSECRWKVGAEDGLARV
jgi:hypothetical protein